MRKQVASYGPKKSKQWVIVDRNVVKRGETIRTAEGEPSADYYVLEVVPNAGRNYLVCKRQEEVTLQTRNTWKVQREADETITAEKLKPGMVVWVAKPTNIAAPAALVVTQVYHDDGAKAGRLYHVEGEYVGYPNYKHVKTDYSYSDTFVLAEEVTSTSLYEKGLMAIGGTT